MHFHPRSKNVRGWKRIVGLTCEPCLNCGANGECLYGMDESDYLCESCHSGESKVRYSRQGGREGWKEVPTNTVPNKPPHTHFPYSSLRSLAARARVHCMLRWQRHHYRIPRHGDHFLRHHRLRALPRVEELASTGRKTQEVRTGPPQPDPPKTGIYHGPNNGRRL